MKKAKSGNLESIVYGFGTTMIAALLLTVPGTALIMGEILNQNTMMILGVLITAVSCFLGGWVSSKKAVKAPLPMALVSIGLYLLTGFVIRGILFEEVAPKPWIIILAAVIPAIVGSMTAAGKKQRVKHRI